MRRSAQLAFGVLAPKTLGEIWGYHVEGLFKTDREAAEYQASIDDKAVNNRVYQNKGPAGNRLRAGDVRFADLDGNNIISEGSGTVDDPGDKRIIGNSLPRYNYSFRSWPCSYRSIRPARDRWSCCVFSAATNSRGFHPKNRCGRG